MEKVIRDGKVAVLYSPGFGAGWSSWNPEYPAMLFDTEIVLALEDGRALAYIEKIAQKNYPGAYLGGMEDLDIAWIPEGSQFEIEEYDGSESIHIIGTREYYTA